jgi:hypothetical protein
VFIARVMCGIERERRRLVLQLQSAEVSRTVTSSFVWSWTITVNVNEGIQDPESWTQYSSCVSALFIVYAQKTPVHLKWGLLRVCTACPTPHLNLSLSSLPPGTTSTIRSPPGPRTLQHPSHLNLPVLITLYLVIVEHIQLIIVSCVWMLG